MTYAKIQETINRYNEGLIGKTEAGVVNTFRAFDKELSSLLTELYKKYDLPILVNGVPDGNATILFMRQRVIPVEGGRITRLNALRNDVQKILGPALLRKDKQIEQMSKIMYQNGYYNNLYAIERTTGIRLDFALLNERAITSAVATPISVLNTPGETNQLKTNRANTITKINREIEMGLGRGDGVVAVARKIDQALGFRDANGKLIEGKVNKRGATYESLRIARTEMMQAYATGQHDQFEEVREQLEEEGLEPRLKWIATLDDRTRRPNPKTGRGPDHGSMDGELSNADGEFTLNSGDNEGAVGIQHNFGIPEEDINCRCSSIQVIEGLEPIVRRSRKDGVIPMTTFTDWADEKGIDASIYGEQYRL